MAPYSPIMSRWLERHQSYGALVNSHDLIKALAVIIMICDHIGQYLAPNELWFRAIGRIGFPVWFFMAGYTKKGGFTWELLPGMSLLVLTRYILGIPVLAINALLTIFLIRVMILYTPADYYKKNLPLVLLIALLACLFFNATSMLFEYGTIGLLFGYLGYAVRNTPDTIERRILALACFVAFMATQLYPIRFDILQTLVIVVGTAAFMYWLYFFQYRQYNNSQSWHGFGVVIRGLGRHTLLIYVLHLYILAIVMMANRLS